MTNIREFTLDELVEKTGYASRTIGQYVRKEKLGPFKVVKRSPLTYELDPDLVNEFVEYAQKKRKARERYPASKYIKTFRYTPEEAEEKARQVVDKYGLTGQKAAKQYRRFRDLYLRKLKFIPKKKSLSPGVRREKMLSLPQDYMRRVLMFDPPRRLFFVEAFLGYMDTGQYDINNPIHRQLIWEIVEDQWILGLIICN